MIRFTLALVMVAGLCFVGIPSGADTVNPYVSYDAANGLPIGPDAADLPVPSISFLTWGGDGEAALSIDDGRLTIDTSTHGDAVGNESRFWFDLDGIPGGFPADNPVKGGVDFVRDSLATNWQIRVSNVSLPPVANSGNEAPVFSGPPDTNQPQKKAMEFSFVTQNSVDVNPNMNQYRLHIYNDENARPIVQIAASPDQGFTAAGTVDDPNTAFVPDSALTDGVFTVDMIGGPDGPWGVPDGGADVYVDGQRVISNFKAGPATWNGIRNQFYLGDSSGAGGNGTITFSSAALYGSDGNGGIPGPIPEPSTLVLLGLGVLGLIYGWRKRA